MKRCYDCAYCSTYVYKFGDCCDIDNHTIIDVFNDYCGKFEEADADE